jgi:hypothetical protein
MVSNSGSKFVEVGSCLRNGRDGYGYYTYGGGEWIVDSGDEEFVYLEKGREVRANEVNMCILILSRVGTVTTPPPCSYSLSSHYSHHLPYPPSSSGPALSSVS